MASEDVTVPLSDARVRISDTDGNTIIDEIRTDSSGQTPMVDVPAPPLEYSVVPSDVRPYAEYNVTVRAADFQTFHVGGVQVLPNRTALQRTILKPIQAGGFNVQNLFVEPHTLWGEFPPKIPEDEVKPLPESSGLVVLPRPVVPEFIIVHLGIPSDTTLFRSATPPRRTSGFRLRTISKTSLPAKFIPPGRRRASRLTCWPSSLSH